MIWHRKHVDIVECVTHAQRSRRVINDLAERNADGADINDLAESLLLTEKKHITTSPDYDRLIPVPYELLFDPLRILVYVIYKLPFGPCPLDFCYKEPQSDPITIL
jgi:hypothetical protein